MLCSLCKEIKSVRKFILINFKFLLNLPRTLENIETHQTS